MSTIHNPHDMLAKRFLTNLPVAIDFLKAHLPQAIKDFVSKNFPEYEHAPATFTAPNMTSWKYYKKVMEGRKKKNG